jgi:hypothetical protein
MSRRQIEQLDEAIERVAGVRDALLRDRSALNRADRLALLFESEARLWSQLLDDSSLRLIWRAALAAEAGARVRAAMWRWQAERELDSTPPSHRIDPATRVAA